MPSSFPPPLRCPLRNHAPELLTQFVSHLAEPAVLESGSGFGDSGRWSFYAAEPRLVFEATDDRWAIRSAKERSEGEQGALEALGRLINRFGLSNSLGEEPTSDAPPFTGGLVGYYGYDLAPNLERLPRRNPRDSALPDIRFALYDNVIVVDHVGHTTELWTHDFLHEGSDAQANRSRPWMDRLECLNVDSSRPVSELGPVEGDISRDAYLASVEKALEYIAAGDIFQVNLSQRFTTRGKPVPFDLYLRLRKQSPAPFAAFLQWNDLAIVSASPEWFYQTRGDLLITRPIKGTRPRGATEREDAQFANELLTSPKDRAELTMIVDLERNDLGRVCRFGSVRVIDALCIESFAQVHHLVATVEGQLREDVGAIDIARALFPGGSITGAPKIRAMEIIDELEPTRRSLYTGAIGYYGLGGASGFNIAIRTMLVEGDRVSYQVGGGIVADSDPQAEYLETLAKGRGIRAVLEGGGR
ncbi:aminodeoxychorismate synthase component I [Singulisphaera sp. PoT]|uniref:aminodeoxychorismate synthase component I n=1 Tax=Singulisphaera sp. PoT TaxID=3411797 RepID=UPI003BF47E9E